MAKSKRKKKQDKPADAQAKPKKRAKKTAPRRRRRVIHLRLGTLLVFILAVVAAIWALHPPTP